MKIDKFYKETIVLSISNITMGLFRFVFSIILSKKLGSEGLGLYSIILPIYDLFCCLSCGGLVSAISSRGAEFVTKGNNLNLIKTIRVTAIFDFIWSLIIALLMFFNSSAISIYILKDIRSITSLRMISIAIIFISLSNVLKGYFLSLSKASIPAFIDIFEKVVRISMVLLTFHLIKVVDIPTAVTLVFFALCMGEGFSLLMLIIFYKTTRKKIIINYNVKSESMPQLLIQVLIIAIPLALNGFLSSILGTASTLILPRRLVSSGIPYETALSMIGEFSGMAVSIILFPSVIISAISTIIVPEISGSLATKNFFKVEKRIGDVIRVSLYLGIATLIICSIIPKDLGILFFNKASIYKYIFTAALCCPLYFTLYTTYGVMSGIGKQKDILLNSLIISILDIIILYIFGGISWINIYAYAITLFLTSLVGVILNIISIRSFTKIRFGKYQLISTCIITILTALIVAILNNLLINFNCFLKTLIVILVAFSSMILGGIKIDRLFE
ncbi:stage V sporulation protein B [Clostridium bornimense]|uniref:Multidrug-efflux transporter n=1 Tax=Clostridium bornimense TaxID=1216932 RepID=W6S215_9CLOT|nr:stage V sporulation protein B [Clostridium bornimense]CDM68357.1 stage V sporulation protein B [Clostridium bornimense]